MLFLASRFTGTSSQDRLVAWASTLGADNFAAPSSARVRHPNFLALSAPQCTRTVLGQVPADVEALNRLAAPIGNQFNHAGLSCGPQASKQQRNVLASFLTRIRSYE